jgi:hypothetical protein
MMLEAVFIFGALNVLFEFVLLALLPVRTRLRILGSNTACMALHFLMLGLNLFIHFGTLIGTMSSILAFVCSLITVAVARHVFGSVVGNRYYRVGLKRYAVSEVV